MTQDSHTRPGTELGVSPAAELLCGALLYRRAIARTAAVFAVIAATIVLLRAPTWTARASFIAQTGQTEPLGQIAGLASQVGLNLGGATGGYSPRFYAALATSSQLLGILADTGFVLKSSPSEAVRVADALAVSGDSPAIRRENVITKLRENVIGAEFNQQTGMTSLSVKTKSPELSYAIAEATIAEINRFNSERRRSRATAEREFTGERRDAVAKELDAAEDAVASFVMQNRAYIQSPELKLRYDRLNRRVTELSTVLAGLSQLYERARVDEVRDTPVLTVVDSPVVPAVRDRRGLISSVLGAAALGASLALALVLSLQVTGALPTSRAGEPKTLSEYSGVLRREFAKPWKLLF
jgi:hypothetical protein